MRFKIWRASNTNCDTKPCADAVEVGSRQWEINIPDMAAFAKLIEEVTEIIVTRDEIVIYDSQIE
jgi:hypothetical protein